MKQNNPRSDASTKKNTGTSSTTRLSELSGANTLRFLMAVGFDWLVIGLAMFAAGYFQHPVACLTAVLFVGVRQHGLFIMAHDGGHFRASKNRKLNDFLTNIFCVWPFGRDLEAYRQSHFEHHRYVGTKDDPELHFRKLNAPHWDLPTTQARIFGLAFKDLIGIRIARNILVLGWSLAAASRRDQLISFCLLICVSALLWSQDCLWVLAIWFIALLTVAPASFRLREWTEHINTHETHRITASWWQRFFFLAHNTWYHFEHHRWSQIPSWNLAKVRSLNTDVPVKSVSQLFREHATAQSLPSGLLPDDSSHAG